MNDLIVIPKESAIEVFSAANGLDPYLQKVRDEIDTFNPDVSTKKGRDAIASIAYKVAKIKTSLDSHGKELVAELKDVPKRIDGERKRMRDLLDVWKEEVREPLTKWELEEEQRVAAIKARIAELDDLSSENLDSNAIGQMIEFVKGSKIDESFAEFESAAHKAKEAALARLEPALAIAVKREAEAAELERLRAEEAARAQAEREATIAREASEKAQREAAAVAEQERQRVEIEKVEAERAANAERLAAEKRELELKLQAEQAERRAEQAAEQERQRIAAEQKKVADEAATREANVAHKRAVNKAAKEALIQAGMDEKSAEMAIKAIAMGKVPSVKIFY